MFAAMRPRGSLVATELRVLQSPSVIGTNSTKSADELPVQGAGYSSARRCP